jgi:membrane protein YqaA with SNARE-associated domain
MQTKTILKPVFQGLFLLLFIGLAFYFAHLAKGSEAIRATVASYGYIGIFIISIISGFNLVVPIPAISFLPLFLQSGLGFWPTIFIITIGMTLADTVAYLLGDLGKKFMPTNLSKKLERYIKIIHEKYNWAPLIILFFFAAVVPLPNELLLLPFAFLNYRLVHIFPVVFTGNLVLNILYSQGIINIFGLF